MNSTVLCSISMIIARSMRMVKRPCGSAQGTRTWPTPCSSHEPGGHWPGQGSGIGRCLNVARSLPAHGRSNSIPGCILDNGNGFRNHVSGICEPTGLPPQAAHPPLSKARQGQVSADIAHCCFPEDSSIGKGKSLKKTPTKFPDEPILFSYR
jgi:hypothetical protein